MFNKLKEAFGKNNNKKNVILAPVEGEVCPLSEVSDPTFGTGILGKGVAIKPGKGRIVAPADGVVTIMFETKHAVSITSDGGAEILIHIGLDTVNLKGEYFKAYVKAGDRVKAGDLLVEFDIPKIKEAGYDVITPVVVCNSDDFPELKMFTGKTAKELDEIINI